MEKHYYFLRWLIPNSLLIFLAIGAWHYGFLFNLYAYDKSYISTLITIIYLVTSLYCLYRMFIISDQINQSNLIKAIINSNSNATISVNKNIIEIDEKLKIDINNFLSEHLRNLINFKKDNNKDKENILLDLFLDKLKGEIKIGSFISDSLFKLGLLGTIIGFVLMLQPISNVNSFDEISIKNALTAMSAGMSIALFTTLSGLIGSLLLKVQYYFFENSTEKLFHQVSELSEIHIKESNIK